MPTDWPNDSGTRPGEPEMVRGANLLPKEKRIVYAHEYSNVYALVCRSHRSCLRYCAVRSQSGVSARRVGELSASSEQYRLRARGRRPPEIQFTG